MIVATHKCGCPPKDEEPPCSPCCTSGKRMKIKRPTPPQCPESSCCKKQRRQPIVALPKIEEPPPCCPIKPSDSLSDLNVTRKVRSEIAEKGLPYKELEAVINNNRLVIRTQKEVPREEYDPPCDCIEDSQPIGQDTKEDENSVESSRNRTVTLFPRPRADSQEIEETDDTSEMNGSTCVEENPNIFLLRVRKKCREEDKGYNIDLEFKTPRPWSLKRRLEMKKQANLA